MPNPYHDAYIRSPVGLFSGMGARGRLVDQYAWAIPNDEAIELLVSVGPIVEIGAGKGYWASLVRQAGGDIVAYDIRVRVDSYTGIEEGGPEYAGAHHDRTLLLCWPPYDTDMAYDALYSYLEAGGRRVVYVGEGRGGCTANDGFYDLLAQRTRWVDEIEIPTWCGIRDSLTVWERRES